MSKSIYLALAFDLNSDGSFRDQSCYRAETLATALLTGARGNLASGGVIIVRTSSRMVEVIARCGLAENPCVAAYAEADVRFGLWPGLDGDVESDEKQARA